MNSLLEPWAIHDQDYCPEEIYGDLDLEESKVVGKLICTINTELPEDTIAAIGRLIVSAPKLLAACKAVAKTCGHHDNWNGDTREFLILVEDALRPR